MTYVLESIDDQDKHHMLGYAYPAVQDDPLYHVPGASNGKSYNEGQGYHEEVMQQWLLLLQITYDDKPKMFWDDGGSLYYMLRRDDLITKQFHRGYCESQSS